MSLFRRAPPCSTAGRGPHARLRRGDRLAQLAAAHGGRPAREGRARRLLDVHVHQLAAHARLRPRLGREVRGARTGRRRRPHARVPVRARDRERPPGRGRSGRPVPDRARQRLRRVAGVQQPLLAGRLHRGCGAADPPPSVRRGRLRRLRARDPAVAGRSRSRGRSRRPGLPRSGWARGAGRLDEPAVAGDVSRLRAGPELRVSRRRRGRTTGEVRPATHADAQPVGAGRGMDDRERRCRAGRRRRAHRLPRARARRPSRPPRAGRAGAVPRAHRR